MPACSPPSCVAHAFAWVRQQNAASSKSPTMANDSAVSRAGIQSSSHSSRRAGAPKHARALRDRRRVLAALAGAPLVGEQTPPRGRAPPPPVPATRVNQNSVAEHLPVRIHEPALDREPARLAARQLGGGAAAPRGERPSRDDQVAGLQARPAIADVRVAETAEAHQQVEHRRRSRRGPAAGARIAAPEYAGRQRDRRRQRRQRRDDPLLAVPPLSLRSTQRA